MTENPSNSVSDREERINQALAEYLKARREGDPNHCEVLKNLSEYGTEIAEFLSDLKQIDDVLHPERPNSKASHVPTVIRELADYTLIRQLGRGGMGVVYLASQRSLDRTVAVKLILAGTLASSEDIQRFQREARLAASLHHRNIVAIHDVGEFESQHYYSMDYVEGKDLNEFIAERGPMSSKDAAQLLLTIAQGVQHANEKGIIHRNLKPGNVLIDNAGVPRITDFGLAKNMSSQEAETATGATIGTPNYMAPEQVYGRGFIRPYTDVYGLGGILYKVLTGVPPFEGGTPPDLYFRVLNREPVAPRKINSTLSRDLENICLKCLEKAPGNRYQSAHELGQDLSRFLRGEPVSARPLSTLGKSLRWCNRNKLLTTFGAFILMATIAAVGGAFWVLSLRMSKAVATARRIAAEESATAQEYYSLMSRAAQGLESQQQNAATQAFQDLTMAAQLNTPARDAVRIRSVANGCLSTHDVDHRRVLIDRYNAHCLAFRHDTAHLAIGRAKGIIGFTNHVFDVTSGHEIKEYLVSSGLNPMRKTGIRALTYSHDGTLLAAGVRDGTIRVWRTDKGDEPSTWYGHGAEVTGLRFSTDDKMLVSCSTEGHLKGWSTADWSEEFSYATQSACGNLDNNSHLKWTAVATDRGTLLLRLEGDAAEPQELAVLPGYRIVAISPDGRFLAADDGSRIVVFALEPIDKVPMRVLVDRESLVDLAHNDQINHLSFAPNATLLVSGSSDGYVKIWELSSGRLARKIRVDGDGHIAAEFSPDGRRLATIGDDKVVLYALHGGVEHRLLAQHSRPVHHVAVSSDRLACLSATGGEYVVTQWKLSDGTLLSTTALSDTVRPRENPPPFLTMTGDGGSIALAVRGQVYVVRDGKLQKLERSPAKKSASLSFSADGRTLWAALDETVGKWDLEGADFLQLSNNRASALFKGTSSLTSLQMGMTKGVVASRDGAVRLLELNSEDDVETFWGDDDRMEAEPVLAVSLNRDETLAASGTQDGTLRVYDLRRLETCFEAQAHAAEINAVQFSPDGSFLAAASEDRSVSLWRVDCNSEGPDDELYTLAKLMDFSASRPVRQVAFSPQGDKLAILARNEFAVHVWDLNNLRARHSEIGVGW